MNTKTTKDKTQPARHTPGPWFTAAQVNQPHNHALIGIGNGAVHVGYASLTPAMSPCEAEANVRLLAAAPELLQALTELLGKLDVMSGAHEVNIQVGHEECYPEVEQAYAAIAKAEGRSL